MSAAEGASVPSGLALSRAQKAAVILGVLGAEAAGPVLAQLDEASLRRFTRAMSSIGRIDAAQVRAVVAEFLAELDEAADAVQGGLARARGLLEEHVAEGVLARILDEAEPPSARNVWQKLARIGDRPLAELLAREHPQTAAVVLSRFDAEHAARVLAQLEAGQARDVVLGISRLSGIEPRVVAAIGETIGRQYLALGAQADPAGGPAARVGAIMDFTSPALRESILGEIEAGQPDFARAVRRTMFTIEDMPARLPARGVPALVRSLERDTLTRALQAMREATPEVAEFILGNISTRMAEQLREELGEAAPVSRAEGERAQTEVIRVIRDLAAQGEIQLAATEDA